MSASRFRVVLVGPENPSNVGFVARAMRCFGVEELTLAASRWEEVPGEARRTGVSAPEILAAARFAPTLSEALRDCAAAIAFSRRPTTLRQEEFSLPSVPVLPRGAARVALVFGRESSGLTREESALCPQLARIPCRGTMSLNLGQAVAISLFALTTSAAPAPADARKRRPAAELDQLMSLWEFWEPRLKSAPRFGPARLERARQMLYRLKLDDEDFGLLFAATKALARGDLA